MLVLEVLAGLAVLFGVFALAAGRASGMSGAQPDRRTPSLPQGRPMTAGDVDGVQLSVGLRGYRMDEVDALLDRLAAEIKARDELLAREEAPPVPGSPRPAEDEGSARSTSPPPGQTPEEGSAWPSSS